MMLVFYCIYSSLVSSAAGVFKFKIKSSATNDKKHRETAERRKSYNTQSSAKKKPRYKPYTDKMSCV